MISRASSLRERRLIEQMALSEDAAERRVLMDQILNLSDSDELEQAENDIQLASDRPVSELTKLKTQFFSANSVNEQIQIATVAMDLALEEDSEFQALSWRRRLNEAQDRL